MKVLHVYKTYYPDTVGGVEFFIKELSTGLKEKGIESSVFCLTSQKDEHEVIIDGIKVYKVPYAINIASTPMSFNAFFRFKEIVKDFDIIHYHFPYPFQDLLHLFCARNKKSIVTYHSDIVKQKWLYLLYKPLEKLFLKSVNKIIATSSNYLNSSLTLKKYKRKTSVISIGINEKNYPKVNEDLCNVYKNKFGDKFFLFVGVLRYYKGLHILIDAAKKNGLNVVIAGKGPLENDLKKQSEGFYNIHFIGEINEQEKVNLLSFCYAFVFPSHLRSEAYGISLLEASMYKKPMISCEIRTGTSFINKNNVTGFVVDPNDVNALSNAMINLFNDEKRSKQFGINAYNRYVELFTIDKMIKSYEAVYKSF